MPDRHLLPCLCAVLSLLALPLRAADDEDFNWTEASQFVDSFPFPQKFIDSLFTARRVTAPSPPLRTLPPQSFSQGEMLAYDIKWTFIKGGYVILTATPDPARGVIRLGAKALSRGFVSTFYRMRDYAVSTVDARGLYPLFFEEHLREGKRYRANRWFLFDHARRKLHFGDRSLSVPPFTCDYISVLYMARTRRFAPGDTFMLPFFVDKKLHRLVFSCTRRATAEFNGKKVRCLVVLPQPADDKGEFARKKRLEIWISDDEHRLPVRIKAKITIGSIVADLIYAGRPKTAPRAAVKKTAGAVQKTETPVAPQPVPKRTDTVPPAAVAALHKDAPAPVTAGAAALPADTRSAPADTLRAAPSVIALPSLPAEAVPADTAAPPAPPLSKKSYETIEVMETAEKPAAAPQRCGCGRAAAPHPCPRDNFY